MKMKKRKHKVYTLWHQLNAMGYKVTCFKHVEHVGLGVHRFMDKFVDNLVLLDKDAV